MAPVTPEPEFILDVDSNPHPDLRTLAGRALQQADSYGNLRYWEGVRDAMIAATGSPHHEVVEWVKRGLET